MNSHEHTVDILALTQIGYPQFKQICNQMAQPLANFWVIPNPALPEHSLNLVFTFAERDVVDSLPRIIQFCTVDLTTCNVLI